MTFKQRFRVYENWIINKNFESLPKDSLQSFMTLASQDGNSYLFYRSLVASIIIDDESHVRQEILAALQSINENSPIQYQKLIQKYKASEYSSKYDFGRDNISTISQSLTPTRVDQLWLNYYQFLYELNPIHEFLLDIAQCLKEGEIDKPKFRDRKGNLKKGAVIEYIVSGFQDYKYVVQDLKTGYNPALRNVIGHNNFLIRNSNIINVDNGQVVADKRSLLNAINSIQSIHNSIQNIMSQLCVVNPRIDMVGTISVSYGTSSDQAFLVELYQLWCFYKKDVDPLKDWSICYEEPTMKSKFSDKVILTGQVGRKQYEMISELAKSEKKYCQLYSIKPIISNKCQAKSLIETIDGVHYEVVDSQLYEYQH